MNSVLLTIRQNHKVILQVALGLVFIAFAIYFFSHEIGEFSQVRTTLTTANPKLVIYGLVLLGAFIVVQGMMYRQSFRVIHEDIRLSTGMSLYLKRNLVSVFLPAGVLTNLLFFNESVSRREGVARSQIFFASSIFSFCSIVSGIIVGIPAVVWLLIRQSVSGRMVLGIATTVLLLALVTFLVISFVRRGWMFQLLEKRAPAFLQLLQEMGNQSFNKKRFFLVIGLSVIIEIIGIAHLFISIKALGGTPTLGMAIIGYAVVLLLLMSSPFLRGVGAVEVALTYTLTIFGMTPVMALSVAFLFRFFEFWGVLILGVFSLAAHRDNLVIRLLPAILLFALGLVNILSGITPAIPERLESLSQIIPLGAIEASKWLVILSGVFMLAISLYLVKGLRNAWITALVLTALSLVGHFTKGIDWEEATVAMVTMGSLIIQRHQYFIKPDLKIVRRGIFPGLVAFGGVILFGTIAFWLLNPIHFNTDFKLGQSFLESLSAFFLLNDDLKPATHFARQFLLGMNLLGSVTMVYFGVLLFRPLVIRPASTLEEDRERAKRMVEKYGNSTLDYFKTYFDKKFWFPEEGEGFVAFKTAGNFAIVLGNPVCRDEETMAGVIREFDAHCHDNGLRTAFYRIPEWSRAVYEQLNKRLLPVGETAIVNLETWTIEGSDKRGLRHEVSKLNREGYLFKVYNPPQKDGFLQQLRAVSNEWLSELHRKEMVFSQGLFDEQELKDQVILTLENPEGKVVGFVNLIPDNFPGEGNFDLMRKTGDAPNGAMDFLFMKMFEYLQGQGYKTCNLGMVPMSGIEYPGNIQERVIKLAYERIRQFSHYKSLRTFKEKFNPDWTSMYLAYEAPFDLVNLPNSLDRVFENEKHKSPIIRRLLPHRS